MANVVGTYTEGLTPAGYEKLTVDNTSGGVALTVPTKAHIALMKLEDGKIRFRDDGTDPTSSEGFPLDIGETLEVVGEEGLSQFKAIRTSSTSGTLYILYYKK